MQLYPILLIGVLLMAGGGLGIDAALPPRAVAMGTLAPIAGVLALQWLGTAWCRRRLRGQGAPAAVARADRLGRGARLLLVGHFAVAALVLGLPQALRRATGNLLLVDELLCLLPTLAGLAGTWWIYYPVERRLREALLLRHIDLGRPLFLPPGRGRYVLMQVRLHLLFLLVPIMLILGAAEAIDLVVAAMDGSRWAALGETATVVAAAMVVLAAPLLARAVLDVGPLEDGQLRARLLAMCRAHGVAVRDVLVWRTQGSMVNAAVMGLIGPLRYVLLTDALLESMDGLQLESVMAHEIGHVRRHHMFWLLVCVLASALLAAAPMVWAQQRLDGAEGPWAKAMAAAAVTCAAGAMLLAFGWVSRRFERQADAFAVRHFDGAAGRISAEAVAVLCGALRRVAAQSAVPQTRRSWRHGSIAARQAHLESIVGLPQEKLPIDRQVRWIKAVAAAVAAAGLLYGAARGLPEKDPWGHFRGENDPRGLIIMEQSMLRFTKMHGAGNDFVFLDGLAEPQLAARGDLPDLARAMCDRRRGVGADGLIVICAAGPPAAVRMKMFNTDGSESAMCGNGLRCLVKYVLERNLVREGPGGRLAVATGAGIVEAAAGRSGAVVDAVTVDMGRPVLELPRVPVDRTRLGGGAGPGYSVAVDGARYEAVFVSMGNPHAAIYVDDVAGCDVAAVGPRLEHHAAFPQRMNVHFVQVAGPGEVIVRHWERGCGETWACGSGACAVCVAGVLTGRTQRRLLARLPGGEVTLHWEEASGHVYMTGGAVEVFSGQWRQDHGAG